MSLVSLSRPEAKSPDDRGNGYLLQSEADLADAVTYAVERSTALGAGAAIARVSEGGGISVTVANGGVENAVRDGHHDQYLGSQSGQFEA